MTRYIFQVCIGVILSITCISLHAQNPLIRNQFSADPSARVFGNRVYLFPSHDILATEGRGRKGWFCMEDYHVFSSENLTDWTDHGMIVQQHKVPWIKPDSYSMWAPDCIYRNGKYYFYFPSIPQDTSDGRGFRIGVAIADKPEGPYMPLLEPVRHVRGIDPNVFIDKDGQAYLYWSQGNIYGARLKDNMVELASEPVTLQQLPEKGLKEGPWLFERNGIYYLTYPHVENKIERLEYAVGDHPLGPFKRTGVIMDESPTGCWTNHHSVIQFKDQWYLFYHHNDYSPGFDKARSVRADSLFFNADGTIQKVAPTYRGIGITRAHSQIQIDRYTQISNRGVSIEFLDTTNRFSGWKAVFTEPDAWVQYNSVDFEKQALRSVLVRLRAPAGGRLQIRMQDTAGPLLADLTVRADKEWQLLKLPLLQKNKGVGHLLVVSKDKKPKEVDWIRFE